MFEGTFTITLVSIIALSVIVVIMRGRLVDRCLKDFKNHKVILETLDGNIIKGNIDVRNNGVELVYEMQKTDDFIVENSYIMYSSEYGNIYSITRYLEEMTKRQSERRALELHWSYHPGFLRKIFRGIRNWINTIRDTVIKIMQLFIGAKGLTGAEALGQTQTQYATQLGEEIMGRIGTAYDPMLEKHIGQKVVVEVKRENKTVKYSGILKCYTAEFIELMDVNYNYRFLFKIANGIKENTHDGFMVELGGNTLRMQNSGARPVNVVKMVSGGVTVEPKIFIQQNKKVEFPFDGNPNDLTIYCEAIRLADLIMPRLNCIVRHSSE